MMECIIGHIPAPDHQYKVPTQAELDAIYDKLEEEQTGGGKDRNPIAAERPTLSTNSQPTVTRANNG